MYSYDGYSYAEYWYAVCLFAEFRDAERHYAECCGAHFSANCVATVALEIDDN